MEFDSGFRITLFSHPDYDNLTAEIYFGEQFISLISQENGRHWLELSSKSCEFNSKYDLDAFLEALATARSRL